MLAGHAAFAILTRLVIHASDCVRMILPGDIIGGQSKEARICIGRKLCCALCHFGRCETVLSQGSGQQDSETSSHTSEAADVV